jgi:hypothetical protein
MFENTNDELEGGALLPAAACLLVYLPASLLLTNKIFRSNVCMGGMNHDAIIYVGYRYYI